LTQRFALSLLMVVWIVVLSPSLVSAEPACINCIPVVASPDPFNLYDLVAGPVSIGMDSDIVLELIEEPSVNYIDHDPVTGRHTERQERFGLTLCFVEDFALTGLYLMSAEISSGNIPGPRGITVGDKLETVLASFPADNNPLIAPEGSAILYAAALVSTNEQHIVLPPRGVFRMTPDIDGFQIVTYDSPTRPYPIAMADDEYIYEEHASCAFYIKDGQVAKIIWSLGTLAP